MNTQINKSVIHLYIEQSIIHQQVIPNAKFSTSNKLQQPAIRHSNTRLNVQLWTSFEEKHIPVPVSIPDVPQVIHTVYQHTSRVVVVAHKVANPVGYFRALPTPLDLHNPDVDPSEKLLATNQNLVFGVGQVYPHEDNLGSHQRNEIVQAYRLDCIRSFGVFCDVRPGCVISVENW